MHYTDSHEAAQWIEGYDLPGPAEDGYTARDKYQSVDLTKPGERLRWAYTRWIPERMPGRLAAKALLAALAERTSGHPEDKNFGIAVVSQAKLEEMLCTERSTLRRAANVLVACGLLSVYKPGYGGCNRYMLAYPERPAE